MLASAAEIGEAKEAKKVLSIGKPTHHSESHLSTVLPIEPGIVPTRHINPDAGAFGVRLKYGGTGPRSPNTPRRFPRAVSRAVDLVRL